MGINRIFTISVLLILSAPTFSRSQHPISANDLLSSTNATATKLSGQRVMQTFDFEERAVHFQDVPMYWKKISNRPGYPHYSIGKLASDVSRNGQYSFKLASDGGSVAFEYARRRIKVKAGNDSQVKGYVHLKQADKCRAMLSCVLTDRIGKEIPGSFSKSQLIGEDDLDNGGWAQMEVYVPGNFPDARFISISVWLLQEEQWNRDVLSGSYVYAKNINSVAWFDDITITQLPRIILKTQKTGNVFEDSEIPRILVEVESIGTLDYQAHISIKDSENRIIHNQRWILSGVEGETKVSAFELPDIPAGIYKTQLDIFSSEEHIATRFLTFIRLAVLSQNRPGSGGEFGVIVMDDNAGDLEAVIELTRLLKAKIIKLPVWRRRADEGGSILSEKQFDNRLIDLQRSRIKLVAAFDEVPDAMAAKLSAGRRGLLDILSQNVEIWRNDISFILARYALQIPYWQVGADQFDQRKWDNRVKPVITALRKEFDKVVKNTTLAAPISAMFDIDSAHTGGNAVSIGISSAIAPEQIPYYLDTFTNNGHQRQWVTIKALDEGEYRRSDVLIDFAKRIVFAKSGGVEAIFTDHPWEQYQYKARLVTEPSELFLVYRTLADQLGGTTYSGQFNLAKGVPALIFNYNGSANIITWNTRYNEFGEKEPEAIDIYLGGQPVMLDLFGNTTKLPLKNGSAKLRITNWPVIISNVDGYIAELRSTLRFSPSVLNASISSQQVKLRFVNPFKSAITGELNFLSDDPRRRNWLIEPGITNFALQPGETNETEIELQFPPNELGGEKMLPVQIRMDAEKSHYFQAHIPFEIKLEGIDVNIFPRRINNIDLFIQQVVTNVSDKKMTLHSFIDLPDLAHRELVIQQLEPGSTVTKEYYIKNAVQWLGRYIRVGLEDPRGTKRINYLIEIN